MLLDPSTTKMVSYSAVRATSSADRDIISKKRLNPVTLTPSDTQEVHLWDENTITAPEVFRAVKTMKGGKAGGCDAIRPQMFI